MRTRLELVWLIAALVGCGNAAVDGKAAIDAFDATTADAGDGLAQDAGSQDAADAVDVPGKPTFETADPKRVVVLNYNVMCSFCLFDAKEHPTWANPWQERLPYLRDVIARHDPDLMAIQELQEMVPGDPALNQPQQLIAPNNLYDFEFFHHQPGSTVEIFDVDYDDATVFWKKSRFTKLETGVFWLSSTPDVPQHNDFGNATPRMVVWVLLHDKTNDRDFYFVNTHFDNTSPSQVKSAPLVLDRLAPLAAKHPLVFAGDFNAATGHPAYAVLTQGVAGKGFHFQNSKALAKIADVFSNVAPPPLAYADLEDIDHVFVAGATFDVTWWLTDFWRYGALLQAPSDHEGAVVTSLQWQ